MRSAFALSLLVLIACGGETTPEGSGGNAGAPGVGGGGGQQELPWADGGCEPGSYPGGKGTCLQAGIEPADCGEGFEPDGERGCRAVLPASCAPGLVALPGDADCHEIAPCGEGTWGDIPVESNTEYVDASYQGGGSDGSSGQPWTTIAQGIAAAEPGAIVAVAAGSYAEVLDITASVRLWGRCPSMVTVASADPNQATVLVRGGSEGVEIRNVTIDGGPVPLGIANATDVTASHLRIRGGTVRGIEVSNALGPASFSLLDSLIEDNHGTGVLLGATTGTIERTVIRNTLPNLGDQARGRALVAQNDAATMTASDVTLRASVLEGNRYEAITILASTALIEGSVVRQTAVQASDGIGGRGINIVDDFVDLSGMRSDVVIRQTEVVDNLDIGVSVFGSDALVEHTTLRRTGGSNTASAKGLLAQIDPITDVPTSLTLRASALAENEEAGVVIINSVGTIEGVVVRDIPGLWGVAGRGIQVQGDPETKGEMTITGALVEGIAEAAVSAGGNATALVEGLHVRGSIPRPWDMLFGMGVTTATIDGQDPAMELTRSWVEDSAFAGVSLWGSSLSLGTSLLECNPVHLAADVYEGSEPFFDDQGGNQCACGAPELCKVSQTQVAPPSPLPEVDL
jgi:hypothetical protein